MADPESELATVRKEMADVEAEIAAVEGTTPRGPNALVLRDTLVALQMKERLLSQAARGNQHLRPPGYSTYLAEHWGIQKPYVQYMLYGSCLGGLGYMARSFWRARMMLESSLEPDPVKAKELRLFAAATVEEVEAAAFHAARFCTRGAVAAVAAPILWLAAMSCKPRGQR